MCRLEQCDSNLKLVTLLGEGNSMEFVAHCRTVQVVCMNLTILKCKYCNFKFFLINNMVVYKGQGILFPKVTSELKIKIVQVL